MCKDLFPFHRKYPCFGDGFSCCAEAFLLMVFVFFVAGLESSEMLLKLRPKRVLLWNGFFDLVSPLCLTQWLCLVVMPMYCRFIRDQASWITCFRFKCPGHFGPVCAASAECSPPIQAILTLDFQNLFCWLALPICLISLSNFSDCDPLMPF